MYALAHLDLSTASFKCLSYFLKYLEFLVSSFWLEIAYFGLNFDDFLVKIVKNVKIKYSNRQKAHPWHNTRLLGID